MLKISPSILACDFSRLSYELEAMDKAGADMIHLDVMDGHFVPNISFGPPVISKLRSVTRLMFDAHLMITEPARYIEDFVKSGCDRITFHVEADGDVREIIRAIKSMGIEAGLAVKPATPPEVLLPYLPEVDMLLVMTVEPGFGGQSFMREMCGKIRYLRDAADAMGLDTDIQVDGGIDAVTGAIVKASGANVLVAGTSLFLAHNYKEAVTALRLC